MKIKSILLEIEDDLLENHKFIISNFSNQNNDSININTTEKVNLNNKHCIALEKTQKHNIIISLECLGYTITEL